MIDFEKFGWTPSDESQSEVDDQVQEEEIVEEQIPEVEETHEEYQPVSQKKPGKANIVVVGVGGGGNNAVNNMIRAGIKSASFVVMNTDMQALNMSLVAPHCKIQLGANMTGGLGAGSDPEVGRKAAEESPRVLQFSEVVQRFGALIWKLHLIFCSSFLRSTMPFFQQQA